VISFFTIGIIWVNHHALVSNIVAVDRVFLFLNLVLLLFVVMVPFATGTVSDYLSRGGFDAEVAVSVYGGVLTGMSIGFASMFEWSLHQDRARTRLPPDKQWAARRRFGSGGLVYAAITGLAFVSYPTAFALAGAVAVYYVFERTPSVRAASERGPGQD
jgi:uncharacterized membrane protein